MTCWQWQMEGTMLFLFCWILVLLLTLLTMLLLQRLHWEICLDSTVLSWFSSYLSGKFQQVIVVHSLSLETPLLCRAVQGSVLGPLLFSLYTRQFTELTQTFCIDYHFFLDYSKLYSFLSTKRKFALKAIKKVVLLSWDLELDAEKRT